ncbi:MAG: glycosyltransferase [Pseudomonadota bacterium]
MAEPLRISVIVVSSGRAAALCRCLTAVAQMPHPALELVVVADEDGLAAITRLPFHGDIVQVAQTGPNISTARNDGIAAASGEVLAFIDDDAVPEPSWAGALAEVFADPGVMAATGPVLGRNGISLQWGRMAVNRFGQDRWLEDGSALASGEVLKLHGTNMAIRRAALDQVGGFDRAFAFYLDDTDMALRLGGRAGAVRYLSDAVVLHGFAASVRRREDRVPLSLFDVGASTAVFLRKYAPVVDHPTHLRALEAAQQARLLRFARKRKLGVRDMRRVMESLMEGLHAGAERPFDDTALPERSQRSFQTLTRAVQHPMQVLSGWRHQGPRLRQAAADLLAEAYPVTLFLFDPTPRKHKVRFTEGGWWEQTGGLYGSSDRSGARFQPWRFSGRVAAECRRVARLRGFRSIQE